MPVVEVKFQPGDKVYFPSDGYPSIPGTVDEVRITNGDVFYCVSREEKTVTVKDVRSPREHFETLRDIIQHHIEHLDKSEATKPPEVAPEDTPKFKTRGDFDSDWAYRGYVKETLREGWRVVPREDLYDPKSGALAVPAKTLGIFLGPSDDDFYGRVKWSHLELPTPRQHYGTLEILGPPEEEGDKAKEAPT